jgi:ubiquinone/menaquinone biosynthesis C-methylase UbiE
MNKIEEKTKAIFNKIHEGQLEEESFMRLKHLLDTNYLGVDNFFFQDKVCLDAGCGANANATVAMVEMGAKKVHALDLNKVIKSKYFTNLDSKKYNITTGSVLDCPFEDEYFDFTHCSGVLHHTTDPFLGINELCRVTKPGGMIYILVNGKGGLMADITKTLRKKYSTNIDFQNLIDKLDQKEFYSLLKWINAEIKTNTNHKNIISDQLIEQLFNEDLALTIKDRITAPLYHEIPYDSLFKYLKERKLKNIKRITRYANINNIRKYLAPFYFKYNSSYSKLLYGDGVIQLTAIKT